MSRLSEIFGAFLILGLTSFGGPIAHIGYFREEFVVRRKWLSETDFAEIVSICQFLPGPTSSQAGFMIGLHRGGCLGAFIAFVAFTLPSATIMILAAYGMLAFKNVDTDSIVVGLKLAAVVIVAQALIGMIRNLTPDRSTISIALVGASLILLSRDAEYHIIAVLIGAALGILFCRGEEQDKRHVLRPQISVYVSMVSLFLFILIFVSIPFLATLFPLFELAQKFFHAGSLVFGGGHVVLPLLETEFVSSGLIDKSAFLAGYGLTQAMPGPLFAFASYLGVLSSNGSGGLIGAIVALVAIFLPGFLLVIGIIPLWAELKKSVLANAAIRGVNASVVGILGAALYHPIWTGSVSRPVDLVLVLFGYVLLMYWRLPIWLIVIIIPAGVVLLRLLGL